MKLIEDRISIRTPCDNCIEIASKDIKLQTNDGKQLIRLHLCSSCIKEFKELVRKVLCK